MFSGNNNSQGGGGGGGLLSGNPMALIGLALMASDKNSGQGIGSAIGQMMQMQQFAANKAAQEKQYELQEKRYGLDEKQYQLQAQAQARLAEQASREAQKYQAQVNTANKIQTIMGETGIPGQPAVIPGQGNDLPMFAKVKEEIPTVEGTGVLGGKIPLSKAQQMLAPEFARAGDFNAALNLLKSGEVKYGDPQTVLDDQGNTVLAQFSDRGDMRKINVTPYNKQIAQADEKLLEDSRDQTKKAVGIITSLNEADKEFKKISPYLTGPVVGKFGPLFSQKSQALQSLTNSLALQSKDLLNMPSNNFSEADRQFLVDIAGGIHVGPEAFKDISGRLRRLTSQSISYNRSLENHYKEHGNLVGFVSKYAQENLQQPTEAQSQTNNNQINPQANDVVMTYDLKNKRWINNANR
jgi:hypothetical protein